MDYSEIEVSKIIEAVLMSWKDAEGGCGYRREFYEKQGLDKRAVDLIDEAINRINSKSLITNIEVIQLTDEGRNAR